MTVRMVCMEIIAQSHVQLDVWVNAIKSLESVTTVLKVTMGITVVKNVILVTTMSVIKVEYVKGVAKMASLVKNVKRHVLKIVAI